jgi:hypothetical protein
MQHTIPSDFRFLNASTTQPQQLGSDALTTGIMSPSNPSSHAAKASMSAQKRRADLAARETSSTADAAGDKENPDSELEEKDVSKTAEESET